MATVVDGLYYSKGHDYIKVDGDFAYIGISDYAQKKLGEVVYVELPEEGDEFSKGEVIYVIESVKAATDVVSVLSGKVIEVNTILEDEPNLLNDAPYENWLVKLQMSNQDQLAELLDANNYKKIITD